MPVKTIFRWPILNSSNFALILKNLRNLKDAIASFTKLLFHKTVH